MRNYYTLINSMGSGAAAIDADALAFITAASITDNTQKTAVNKLVTDLKAYNIWTKMKAIYPFVGGTATSHKFNLKDPRDLDAAYRLVFNGGWTHSSTGALPNGTTAFADTKLKPYVVLSSNSEHLSYYSRTTSNGTEVEIGAESGISYYSIVEIRTAGTTYSQIQGGGYISYSDSDSKGFYIGNRTTISNQNSWKNGIKKITGTNNSAGLVNSNIYIGAFNNPRNINLITSYSTKESAFASIGDGLTDTEAANFYTAVQTYQTTLGRQV